MQRKHLPFSHTGSGLHLCIPLVFEKQINLHMLTYKSPLVIVISQDIYTMGSCVVVLPNVCDFWLHILSPSKELLEVARRYESEIIREVKFGEQQRWEYFKISTVLLEEIVKTDKNVAAMLQSPVNQKDGKWVFVKRCTLNQTLSPFLYELFSEKCQISEPQSSILSIRQLFENQQLFAFETAGKTLNLHTAFESLQTRQCPVLPKQYLLLQLNQTYDISIVRADQQRLIFQSPLTEKLILQLVRKVLSKTEDEEQLRQTLQSIIDQIFLKGQFQKSDLLVQDIFGPNNCEVIGLPPKLIASSLAKFSKQTEVTSNYWDQLQSVLMAFALNIGILAKQQILITKISTVIFKTNEISSKHFLSVVSAVLAPYAQEVWFVKNGSTPLNRPMDIVNRSNPKATST